MRRAEHGLVPEGQGWYVLNARDAQWLDSGELGVYLPFEGDVRFDQVGINIAVLEPGQPACMYHGENAQEDFLVLSGQCLLIVEGRERPLRQWDFFHCPPWTEHVIVGAGDGPALLLAVGARGRKGLLYPANEAALRHGAGVEAATGDPREAYARFAEPKPVASPL